MKPYCRTGARQAPRHITRGGLPLPAAVLGILIAVAALFLPAPMASANAAPGAPVGLAVAPGNAKLVAGWNPPAGEAVVNSYTVQYKQSTAADRPADFDDPADGWVTASDGATETTAEIAGLTNDVDYDVRVRASNGEGDGQWSDVASAAPHEDVVWAAILTVDVYDTDSDGDSLPDNHTHGCIDSKFSLVSIAECRTALTEDEFEFAGATYRWTSLYEVTDPWHHATMGFDSKVPSDSGLRTGTLQVGDKTIYLGETDETRLRWLEDGDGWVVPRDSSGKAAPEFFPTKGQRLPMSLKARIPDSPDDDGNGGSDDDGNGGSDDDGNGGSDDDGNGGSDDDGNGDGDDGNGDGGDPTDQPQRSAIFEQCRSYTQGLEGLRVCVTPFEGRDAVLMLTLSNPAPENGTIVTLATSPTQTASSDDFTMPSTITIGEGETSALITIAITADNEDEDHESLHVYACVRPGCDPLNPIEGEKIYSHGITIPGTRQVGGL